MVIDFTRSNRGNTTGTIPSKPVITCDVNRSWTCAFIGSDTDSYRSIDNVAVAHINPDGSIYLQEIDITKTDLSDNWSVTLPAWYVSNGLTSYSLVGTVCKFTIKPVTGIGGVLTDWTLNVKGTGKDGTAKCGGETGKDGGKGKSGKEKTGPSGKGPGPK